MEAATGDVQFVMNKIEDEKVTNGFKFSIAKHLLSHHRLIIEDYVRLIDLPNQIRS